MTVHIFAPPRSHGGVGAYTDDFLAHVDADVRRIPVNREWLNPLRYLRAAIGARHASAAHVQYVYGMFGPKGAFTLFFLPLVFAFTRGPTIVTVHEVWQRTDADESRLKYAYLRLVHETLVRCTDQLLFLSANAERDFLASVTRADTRIMPHGVRTERRDLSPEAAKESFGYDPDDTVITHHGFLAHRKGCDRFVDLAEAMPDYEFLLAGGSRRENLEDRLHERAPANLRITGVLGDKKFEASFAASDLAVLPYRDINQSGTFNRCATYQLPVVGTRIPYFERLANEYGCVALTDADGLEETVRAILEDDERRRRLAERMTEYRNENSFTAVAAEMEAMYDA
ncbi:glycosyltransferase family 4 protein [Natrinema caseinilyticum]|uniref:glycosyltransferase family 4 protein n=1 Tax=Natrinema caseinilyticum TaxID=2961570 RepID=UPI0020C4C735|nr:glycosyltransferase family 4 protein [Natrinema caseinilyticum]